MIGREDEESSRYEWFPARAGTTLSRLRADGTLESLQAMFRDLISRMRLEAIDRQHALDPDYEGIDPDGEVLSPELLEEMSEWLGLL